MFKRRFGGYRRWRQVMARRRARGAAADGGSSLERPDTTRFAAEAAAAEAAVLHPGQRKYGTERRSMAQAHAALNRFERPHGRFKIEVGLPLGRFGSIDEEAGSLATALDPDEDAAPSGSHQRAHFDTPQTCSHCVRALRVVNRRSPKGW